MQKENEKKEKTQLYSSSNMQLKSKRSVTSDLSGLHLSLSARAFPQMDIKVLDGDEA